MNYIVYIISAFLATKKGSVHRPINPTDSSTDQIFFIVEGVSCPYNKKVKGKFWNLIGLYANTNHVRKLC